MALQRQCSSRGKASINSHISQRHKTQGHLHNNLFSEHNKITTATQVICSSSPTLSVCKGAPGDERAVREVGFNRSSGRHFRGCSAPADLPLSSKAPKKCITFSFKNPCNTYLSSFENAQYHFPHPKNKLSPLLPPHDADEELPVQRTMLRHQQDPGASCWIPGAGMCPQVLCAPDERGLHCSICALQTKLPAEITELICLASPSACHQQEHQEIARWVFHTRLLSARS